MSIARSVLFVLAVASPPLSPLASLGVDAAQHAGHAAGSPSAFVEAVGQATERFRDVRNVPAEYGPTLGCVSGPEEGAMGVHFVNPALLIDGALDATQPEALIHEFKNGGARLVGVEFIVFGNVWHVNHAPNDLNVAVRGGGHNVAGHATLDRGLLIDLSPMKGIHVDLRTRTARAEGGVSWKELNRETQVHGLATTGGVVGSTGIAGLTLGGGIGWLMPKYGLALDNLRAADLIMADGRVLRASVDENADLFWAIRGGGGNFGIAASLEYNLHTVGPVITGGVVAHPLARARDVLKFFRDTCAHLPDEMMLVAGLQTAPDGSNAKLVAVVAAHSGSSSAGEAAVRPLKAFGPPVMDALGPIPYCALNNMLDPAFPKGALNYWKAQFLTDLSDEAIRTLVRSFEACPSPMSHIIIEHLHGAASRVPVVSTACTLRTTGFNVVIISQWTTADETERGVAWARDTFSALTPYPAPTRYLNYLEDDAVDPAAVVYGPDLGRLRALETKWDPDNFFRQNVNILPRSGEAI